MHATSVRLFSTSAYRAMCPVVAQGMELASDVLAQRLRLLPAAASQEIVCTGLWITAISGVQHEEQGVALGMASTTLSVGNAIGLAVLIAVANGHAAGQVSVAHAAALADGIKLAFWLAAGGILVSLAFVFVLPSRPRQER